MKKFLGIIGAFLGGVMFIWTALTSLFCWVFAMGVGYGDSKKLASWIDSIGK